MGLYDGFFLEHALDSMLRLCWDSAEIIFLTYLIFYQFSFMVKLSDIFRINGIAFFIIIVQNSFDQKGLPLPTKKRGHILSTISLILKKGLFSIFAQKCIRHMSLFLWCQLFFSMACKVILYKSSSELFSCSTIFTAS